jgi:hypothetical protein
MLRRCIDESVRSRPLRRLIEIAQREREREREREKGKKRGFLVVLAHLRNCVIAFACANERKE